MPHHHAGDDAEPARVMDQLPVPMVPWAVGNSRIPASAEAADSRRIPIQQVIDQVAALGVRTDYSLALPASPDGVYTASYFPPDPKLERTIHIDQYRGSVLRDIRYADYGPIAQAVSYGTSLHMGRYFGLANQIVSALISDGSGRAGAERRGDVVETPAKLCTGRTAARSLGAADAGLEG